MVGCLPCNGAPLQMGDGQGMHCWYWNIWGPIKMTEGLIRRLANGLLCATCLMPFLL